MHKEAAVYTGAIHILDIGLSKAFEKDTHSQYHTIDKNVIKARINELSIHDVGVGSFELDRIFDLVAGRARDLFFFRIQKQ